MANYLFVSGQTDPVPVSGRRYRGIGYQQISKQEWYSRGGLENPKLFRKQSSKGWITYWRTT